MRRKPDIQKLLMAHMRANAQAMAAGLKHLEAKEAGKIRAAKAAIKKAEFWMRRVVRLESKAKAARRTH